MDFWKWLFRGTGGEPGLHRFLDVWLIAYMVVAGLLAWQVHATLEDIAKVFLLPLSGIFIGLTFAWGANAHTILAGEEVAELSKKHPGGFEDYVYTFQLAVLVVFVALIVWGVAGLGFFDNRWPTSQGARGYEFVSGALFLVAGLALRECWQVVMYSSDLLLWSRREKERKVEQVNKPPAGSDSGPES